MSSEHSWALVAGAGQGLGQSLLARFASEGMTVVGLGRTELVGMSGEFYQCDLSDVAAVSKVIEDLCTRLGPPTIVVHNAAELVIEAFDKTEPAVFEQTWKSMVQSLVVLGQAVLDPMIKGDGGTLLVSGATASLRGGVHVCHVILDGIINSKRSRDLHSLNPARMMSPDDIAEVYWQLAQQPKTTWSHELDLRPASEGF